MSKINIKTNICNTSATISLADVYSGGGDVLMVAMKMLCKWNADKWTLDTKIIGGLRFNNVQPSEEHQKVMNGVCWRNRTHTDS